MGHRLGSRMNEGFVEVEDQRLREMEGSLVCGCRCRDARSCFWRERREGWLLSKRLWGGRWSREWLYI